MEWAGITGLVVALLTAAGLLYEKWRAQHRADESAEVEVERTKTAAELEAEEGTIAQWSRYAKEREKQHNADVTRLEKRLTDHQSQIDTLAARERECQIRAAQQEVEIRHLKAEIGELRTSLQKGGSLPPDTAEHKPLGG
jgi:chromosome segregation ATPase